MTFRQKTIAACIWAVPIAGLDIAYMLGHGVDFVAIIVALIALAPAWMFLDRDVDFGSKAKITAADITKAKDQLTVTVPRALRHAETEAGRIHAAARLLEPSQPESLINPPKGSVWIPIGRDDYVSDSSGLAFDRALSSNDRTIMLVKVDPGLVLVNLRIEIEKRLNVIGGKYQLPRTPLLQTVLSLEKLGIVSAEFGSVLRSYISLGNSAAHGSDVDVDAASDVVKSQEIILKALDHIAEYEVVDADIP